MQCLDDQYHLSVWSMYFFAMEQELVMPAIVQHKFPYGNPFKNINLSYLEVSLRQITEASLHGGSFIGSILEKFQEVLKNHTRWSIFLSLKPVIMFKNVLHRV